MHDAKGRPLKAGDKVLIPATITEAWGGEDTCNVSVETILERRPDGLRESFTTQSGVVYRANKGDENGATELVTRLRPEPLPTS